jgi:hypothetical protein
MAAAEWAQLRTGGLVVRATLADTPSPVKPANFRIFTLWGEKSNQNRHRKMVKPANVLHADLHPRPRPHHCSFGGEVWGHLHPDQRSSTVKFVTGVLPEYRRSSPKYHKL